MDGIFEKRLRDFENCSVYNTVKKRESFKCKLRKKLGNKKKTLFRLKEFRLGEDEAQEKFELDLYENLGRANILETLSKSERLITIHSIKHIISSPNPPIEQLINGGLIESLIPYTKSNSPLTCRCYILCIFSNILALSNQTQLRFLEKHQIIDLLFNNLSDYSQEIVENSLWGIANYAANSENTCMLTLKNNFLGQVLIIMKKFCSLEILQIITWALTNIVHYESIINEKFLSKIFKICEKLLKFDFYVIKSEVFNIISILIRKEDKKIEAFINCSLFNKVFYYWNQEIYKENLLKIVSNIAGGTHEQTQFLLDLNILDLILPLFHIDSQEIQQSLYFFLSNIAAGTIEQVKKLISHSVFQFILTSLDSENFNIRTDCTYTLRNIVGVMRGCIEKEFFNNQLMQKLCSIIKTHDPIIAINCLHIFEEFIILYGKDEFTCRGYFEVIEKIMGFKNEEISGYCEKIFNM